VVSEVTPNGQAPIEGVEVWDSYYHAPATTDTNGFYIFRGPLGGVTGTFQFAKEGYQTVSRDVTINGDTRLDVELVRR
jgi:hypothetical protein